MVNVPQVKGLTILFLMKLVKDPVDCLTQLQKQYGDIYRKKFRGYDHYYLCHPKQAEYVLFSNQDNYLKHPLLAENFEKFLGNNNLLMTNDLPQWSRDRELTKTAFEANVFFEQYTTVITKKCDAILNNWQLQTKKEPILFPVTHELDKLALDAIKSTLFYNIDMDTELMVNYIPEIFKLIRDKGISLTKLPWILPTKKKRQYQRAVDFVHEVSNKVIHSRCDSGKKYDDLLGTLVHAYSVCDGNAAHFELVAHHLMTFHIVGYTTTTSALRWVLTMMSQNPEVEDKISREIFAVCNGNMPTYTDVAKLKYTQAVISEVLRLYPPLAFFLRQAIAEDTLGEYSIPAGACFVINPYLIHRHADYWDNPEQFYPERFLEKPAGQDFQYAYIPFGGGKRSCIGKNFAFLEITLIVAMIAQRFRLSLPKDFQIKKTYVASSFLRPNVEHFFLHVK